jgi:hypothetical protein
VAREVQRGGIAGVAGLQVAGLCQHSLFFQKNVGVTMPKNQIGVLLPKK